MSHLSPCPAGNAALGKGRDNRSGVLQPLSRERSVNPAAHGGTTDLPMHHTQRLRLDHYLQHRDRPYLG